MKPSVAVLAIVLVAAAIASVRVAVDGARAAEATTASSSDRVWRSAGARLTVRVPDGWHITTQNLTNVTAPVSRFAIYSGASPTRNATSDGEFTRQLKADQVVVIVMEQTAVSAPDLRRFPSRPHRFAVRRLGGVEGFGDRWAELSFRDKGRAFYAFVGVGNGAARQLPTALHSLDTLRVAR